MNTPREEILRDLASLSIDSAVGAMIENYSDWYGIDDDLRRSVRRFLDSGSTFNRSIAISVLCSSAESAEGLEADALLLHYQGKSANNNTDVEAAQYLYEMQEMGSEAAKRILALLKLDDWWAAMYGR